MSKRKFTFISIGWTERVDNKPHFLSINDKFCHTLFNKTVISFGWVTLISFYFWWVSFHFNPLIPNRFQAKSCGTLHQIDGELYYVVRNLQAFCWFRIWVVSAMEKSFKGTLRHLRQSAFLRTRRIQSHAWEDGRRMAPPYVSIKWVAHSV